MKMDIRWRVLITLGAIALAVFLVFPTYEYFRLGDEAKASMDPVDVEDMKAKALRLGLDLQGGMHVVLEIDDSEVEGVQTSDLMDRALEVIRNRIDEFGVTEPVVQKVGQKRIIVELAGIDDIERANAIIARAAVLEFKMVRSGTEMRQLLASLDLELSRRAGISDADTSSEGASTAEDDTVLADAGDPAVADGDTASAQPLIEIGSDGTFELAQYLVDDARAAGKSPLSSRVRFRALGSRIGAVNEEASVREDEVQIVKDYLKVLDTLGVIPADVEFAWHSETYVDATGNTVRSLYVLDARPALTGEMLEDARPQPDTQSNIAGNFLVEFDLTRAGRRLFSRITGENVGSLMAIVLDGNVKSAPEIHEKIRAGTATITGSFTAQESADLSIVLRAGALPVPFVIEEQRAVGPSLGQDSITLGTQAILFGFIGVLVFMVVYYRVGGAIAVFALLLNLGFLTAMLVYLGAVLTLPGIAGFVLTVGMAVDANVLIFERIREELRVGQTFRNAVNRGYEKAFRTIFDANVTTLITALALLWFGTGPIKGFAVVLSIGIVVSMFTALFVSRVVFDLMTRGGGARSVPI
jgi:protein-export membrane protein SecD